MASGTDKYALDLLKKYLAWMAQTDIDLKGWANNLLIMVNAGIAKCDELQFYNQKAIKIYAMKWELLQELRKAGVPSLPAEPQMPPLFGTSLNFVGAGDDFPTIVTVIDGCTTDGYAPSSMTKVYGSPPCPPTAQQQPVTLGAVPAVVAGCLAEPLICVAVGAFFTGMFVISANAIANTVSAILNRSAEIKRQMQDIEAASERDRTGKILSCVQRGLAKADTSGMKLDAQQALVKQITEACTKAFPRTIGKPPYEQSFWQNLFPVVLVAGITVTVVAVAKVVGWQRDRRAA